MRFEVQRKTAARDLPQPSEAEAEVRPATVAIAEWVNRLEVRMPGAPSESAAEAAAQHRRLSQKAQVIIHAVENPPRRRRIERRVRDVEPSARNHALSKLARRVFVIWIGAHDVAVQRPHKVQVSARALTLQKRKESFQRERIAADLPRRRLSESAPVASSSRISSSVFCVPSIADEESASWRCKIRVARNGCGDAETIASSLPIASIADAAGAFSSYGEWTPAAATELRHSALETAAEAVRAGR